MKLLPAIILTTLAFATVAVSQSVLITPKKVTYTRPKPISEYKKTFTVTYPKIKAASSALSRKIETTLSYSTNLNLNVDEEIREIQWLEQADFAVNYNLKGVLTVTLSVEGSGAYPDGWQKSVVVDLKTGNRVMPANVFTNLPGLSAMVGRKQKAEVAKALKDIKEDSENGDIDEPELFAGKNFAVRDLVEFAVNDKGVTFVYDYNFPHVMQALEPEGRYTFTWEQLRPYIKSTGLLAKFIR